VIKNEYSQMNTGNSEDILPFHNLRHSDIKRLLSSGKYIQLTYDNKIA
jgi:hypothetical protein